MTRVRRLLNSIELLLLAYGEPCSTTSARRSTAPRDFGREADRYCVLELERSLEPGGRYIPTDGLHNIVLDLWTRRWLAVEFVFPENAALRYGRPNGRSP